MEIKVHTRNNSNIAEIISDGVVINTIEDGVDIVGTTYFQGCEKVILHKQNITPEFFDLKNKMAGEILQKFSTYRIQLAIIGDFSELMSQSKSLKDFIYESNQGKQVNFLSSTEEAIERFSV